MATIIPLLVLALAVSLDSFGVGLTYGLRKMKLPFMSLLFIACCSALSILVAMLFGKVILNYLSPSIAEKIGGIILLIIGSWAIIQSIRQFREQQAGAEQSSSDGRILMNIEIKILGLVIRILQKPMEADIDKSGTITGKEAVLLGIALSLDAFGAGVGAALIGFSPFLMAISVAVMGALFVMLGMKSGYTFADSYWLKKFSFLPGLLLISIGLWNMI
ncbi:MAG TPA: sporulation membrane protein YtaF [Bacilli bacterium]|nr:sporulation membrane protein YtaF [Bacilli bacterium]